MVSGRTRAGGATERTGTARERAGAGLARAPASNWADLVAYLLSWNVRVHNMNRPARAELDAFRKALLGIRYRTTRPQENGVPFVSWSFAVIDDLRPREERELD